MAGLTVVQEPQIDKNAGTVGFIQNLLGGILADQQKQKQTRDLQDIGNWAKGGFQGQVPHLRTNFGAELAGKLIDPLTGLRAENLRARTDATRELTNLRRQPATTTPSPIMKMVKEGLLTLGEGKKLARKEKGGELTEKDIISIMHTIERALATTFTVLNEPLPGKKYESRRQYYTKQLEIYRNRLDQLRTEPKQPTGQNLQPQDWQLQGMLTPEMRGGTAAPTDLEDFYAEVERLKAIGDMESAKAYYDKWVSKWQ